jgi:glucose-6-phosphate 1-dehydrogenase
MSASRLEPHVFVIFGATGDLAARKLLPALYHLVSSSHADVVVVGAATRALDDEAFRARARDALAAAGFDADSAGAWCDERVHYVRLPGDGDAAALAERLPELERLHGLGGNRIFYLALPPEIFPPTIEGLGEAGLHRAPGWTRLVIEKPFGRDAPSAAELDEVIHRWFSEPEVYRIDHYLGKETVQNLLVFRFANPIFEGSWNRDRIERVEITVAEHIDVGTRGRSYDRTGAIRDMIQSHLMQLVSLVAMEAPPDIDAESIRAEKAKVLKSIRRVDPGGVVLGRYTGGAGIPGYRELDGVDPESATETYAAVRLEIDNWRWSGVPFVLRTGKAMERRLTEVAVIFRRPPICFFHSDEHDCEALPDVLYLRLQPDEGFDLEIEVKRPDGQATALHTVPLRFQYAEAFGKIPDAYETLLRDIADGDQTRFVRADWVEESWRLFSPILDADIPVVEYPAGSWGPAEARRLLGDADGWSSGG